MEDAVGLLLVALRNAPLQLQLQPGQALQPLLQFLPAVVTAVATSTGV